MDGLRSLVRKVSLAGVLLVLLALTGVVQPSLGQTGAQRRIALVVGIGRYRNVPPLANTTNDARSVASALDKLGFETDVVLDSDKAALEGAVRQFARKATGAGIALFYYAGHGVQVNGRNYLVPADAQLRSERDLRGGMMDVDAVLAQLGSNARVNLVFLDACRNNPFTEAEGGRLQGGRGLAGAGGLTVGEGLAPVQATIGSLIAYATQPGNVAADGAGTNSPFSAAVLRHLTTPGLEIRQMLSRVRQDVASATGGQQVPWDLSSLTADVFFAGPAGVVPTGAVAAEETAYWQSIAVRGTPTDFQGYLRRYPNGTYSELARLRLAQATAAPAGRAVEAATARHAKSAQTSAGQPVLLYGHKNWTSNCGPAGLPSIEIVSPPRGGTITLRPGQHAIDGSWHPGANQGCVGRSVPGVGIYYTPQANFRGQDSFVYVVRLGSLRPIDYDVLATVTVQ